jgi:hypothetical protein
LDSGSVGTTASETLAGLSLQLTNTPELLCFNCIRSVFGLELELVADKASEFVEKRRLLEDRGRFEAPTPCRPGRREMYSLSLIGSPMPPYFFLLQLLCRFNIMVT